MLQIIRFSRFFSVSSKCLTNNFTSIQDDKSTHDKFIKLYMKYLDLNAVNAKAFLTKNPTLWGGHINFNEVEDTLKYLRNQNFTNMDIIERPTCILLNHATYRNRLQVFQECLFDNIQLFYYLKFVSMMNKKVIVLKAYNYIHPSANVIENLIKQFDMPIKVEKELNQSIPLNELRRELLNAYLKEKLHMTNEEITKARGIYVNMKNRNFSSIVDVINLLINEFNFSKERLAKNSYLLNAGSENIRNIIKEVPKIGNTDIKDILHARPKVLMQNSNSIRAVVDHVRSFNIPDEAIEKCTEVLTLGPDTVYSRLLELHKVKEFSVLFSNPRILRLIHYQTKAKTRLDYLKQLKVRCFSLHLLSGPTEMFERYAYVGGDKTKGKDIIAFLSAHFSISRDEMRTELRLHPHWLQVPLLSVKTTLDYLRYRNFTKNEILENVLILLYPITRIKPKLEALLEWKTESDENKKISDVELRTIGNSKMLSLCLYFIESEYHFTGDAVFEYNKLDPKQDPSILPEFPRTYSKSGNYRFKNKEPDSEKHLQQASIE